MKKIETLVEDIYDLFNLSPIERDEKEVDELIDKFGDMLKVHIKEFMYSKPRDSGNLRLSAIGKPNRQIWYDLNTETTEEQLPPSTRIKFLYGYILEELLLLCAEVAGHKVEAQQKEVLVEGVRGHQDAILLRCKWGGLWRQARPRFHNCESQDRGGDVVCHRPTIFKSKINVFHRRDCSDQKAQHK